MLQKPWSISLQNHTPNQNIMELMGIIQQLETMAKDHVLSSEDNMSDADSETLEAAEEEARWKPITRHHVDVFDKVPDAGMRKRRYISPWPGEDLLPMVSDDKFTELFRGHVKRKRIRKKFRLNPDYENPEEISTRSLLTNGTSHDKHHHQASSSNQKSGKKSHKDLNNASAKSSRKRLKLDQDSLASTAKSESSSGKKGAAGGKQKPTTIEQLNARRKKLYSAIMKKEISKGQKARNFNQKERLANRKRVAVQCMRAVRQKAMLTQRFTKETLSRAKRLTREMQNHWKKFDRVERQQKRQLEKEAEEQQKMDLQLLEAKRQQRKLNFLITQTELYAHFMANKVKSGSGGDEASNGDVKNESEILQQLDEAEKLPITTIVDEYDPEVVKNQAKQNALKAMNCHDLETKNFDAKSGLKVEKEKEDRLQPNIFNGTLKKYQLKGMNWLLNLYDQGINGILADEMGLGKTVQALAMLSHIAEHYNIWGPFLVITPASTLHNWQQEVAKFIPAFKVIPYWGGPQERKILRQFWDQSNLHKKSSSFHIVITSYQIVIMDFKHLNRIKWQYLVLDEAQAIKSSSSQRWKMLLEFKCRNRLLLSGTPIQNTMAELWSLLHFVMPTLFDSHEEFNDWFSKDIESSAESKTQIDEKQISRLHMILKPFMLRRIKKDVENELTEKLEVLTYCPLTIRQKHLYNGLKKKIRIEDLLQGFTGSSQTSSITSSLMNLVMQFRKVCNHPELFERRDTRSPFSMKSLPLVVPKMIYRNYFERSKQSDLAKFSIHAPVHVVRQNQYLEVPDDPYAFLRVVNLSPGEFNQAFSNFTHRIRLWSGGLARSALFHDYHAHFSPLKTMEVFSRMNGKAAKPILINNYSDPVSGFSDVKIKVMKETLSHRIIRSKTNATGLAKDIPHVKRPDVIRRQVLVQYPPMLVSATCPKVIATPRNIYAYDSEYYWRSLDHLSWLSTAQEHCQEVVNVAPIIMPDKETLVSDAGKLFVLDGLLNKLKAEGHRVLIYSQMTKMIDLLEEYMNHRKHTYIRLDGSSKIHERRDMVADFQQRSDIFIFLLSTRAGGLGINLTAADTVIFYDSDWNPTVDQQAMDRAHRLGQTKQVTVYRLICKGTIEERILQRAREKSEIQRMVIQGGSFKGLSKPGELRPKEVVSLLLDDEELERKYNVSNKNSQPNLNDQDVDVDVTNTADSSMDAWNEDLIFEMPDSSVSNSRTTTRAPSPINSEFETPSMVVKEEVKVTPKASPPAATAAVSTGRSKRPPSAKRPPKRFDD